MPVVPLEDLGAHLPPREHDSLVPAKHGRGRLRGPGCVVARSPRALLLGALARSQVSVLGTPAWEPLWASVEGLQLPASKTREPSALPRRRTEFC